ncbi:MAG: hypothetical protein ACRDVN_11735 [Jiangellaceae bacterium]
MAARRVHPGAPLGPFHDGSTSEGEAVDGSLRFTGPARFTLVENADGTATNDWELRGGAVSGDHGGTRR